jgi:DNA-binding NarL/FixJ family response regulator
MRTSGNDLFNLSVHGTAASRPRPLSLQSFTSGAPDEHCGGCGSDMIRILVVEDHELVRDALAGLLAEAPGMEVVGVASTLEEARRLLDRHGPDIVLADLSLGDGSALDLVRWVRRSRLDARVVVITGFSNTFAAVEALADGAMGYVLKAQSVADLLVAIRTVADGHSYVAPEVAAKLPQASSFGGAAQRSMRGRGLDALSPREREIFRQAVEGYPTAEIARRLCISPKTVEAHRTSMNRKLAVRTTADLVRFAIAHGFVVTPRALETPPERPDASAV